MEEGKIMKKIEPFKQKVWLASPTMHGEELEYVTEAYNTNWMSTVGKNINEVEKIAAEKSEVKYAVGLSCCTAALHLCCKLAGERLYGKPAISHGALEGRRVFCSDMTFDATLNPVVYEGGIPVFIDTDRDTWNMDPVALEKAFEMYPEVKLVVSAELYGFPGRMDEIKKICEKHGALLIEDAAEAMGATIDGRQCGSFGDYSAVSYNGNKIITGSSGGCLLTNSLEDANKAVSGQRRLVRMRHGISMKRSGTTIVCRMLLQESFVVSIRILRSILRRKKQYTRDTKRVLKDFLLR